jgi:PAS domain S-box-containing protein
MSPEQFLSVADLFPDPSLLLTREGVVVAANRAAAGLGVGDPSGRPLADLVSTPADSVRDYLRLCSRSRDPIPGRLVFRGPGEEAVHCHCHGSAALPGHLLLRLTRRETSPGHFAILTQKIGELTEEVRRRREAEYRLREQTELLRVTLASIGDAVIATDTAGRVTFVNPVAEELTGWPAPEAAGRPVEEVFRIVNEQTREPAENPTVRAIRDGLIVGLANHTVLIARDGVERPIDDSAAPIRDGGGTVAGAVMVFRDVTDRKRAEAELREQTEVAETLNRIGGVLAAELDLQRLVQAVTDEATKLTGAAFGAFFYNVLDDRGEAYTLYTLAGVPREAFANFPMPRNTDVFGPTFRGEGVVRLDDVTADPRYGRNAPYHGMPEGHLPVRSYLAVPVLSRTGEVLGGLFFGHPEVGVFTERHERIVTGVAAQAAVAIDNARLYQRTRESEERFRQLAEHIHGVFWMADPHQRRLLYVSPAYERVWGRTAESLYADYSSFLEAVHPDDRERAAAALPRQAAGEATSLEYRIVRPDGEVRWVWDRGFPIRDESGRVVRVAGIAEDVTERKQTEQQIEDHRRLLNAITDNASASLFIMDEHQRCVFMNPAAEQMTGYTLAEVKGRILHDVIHHTRPDGRPYPLAECPIDRAFPENNREQGEEVFVHKDGHFYRVAFTASPIRDSGVVRGTVIEVVNITERKRAEEAQALLAAIVASSDDAIVSKTLDGVVLSWNIGAERLFGYTAAEAVGRPLIELTIPPDRIDEEEMILSRLRRGERIEHYETVRVTKDGRRVDVSLTVSAVRDPSGRVIAASKVARDITARKRAERDARFLADASAALASLVDEASALQKVARLAVPFFADWCAVDLVAGGDLRRVAVAHADPAKVELAQELYRKYPPNRDAPIGAWHVVRTGRPELVPEIGDEMLASSAPEPQQQQIIRGLGLRSYMGVPLALRDKVLGVITFIAAESGRRYDEQDLAVASDLAHRAAVAVENARLYQALKEADRRKDEFLATLAHELRNPLAPIRNGLEVMKRPGVAPDAVRQAREMADRQVQHLTRLVNDLVDVSRIVRGKIELRPERMDLREVIARAVEAARPAIEAEGHQLTVELPPGPVPLDADPIRLTQVVVNLLINAARYTDRGGQIWLSAGRKDGWAVIRVRDTGIGLAPESLTRIFELFAQVAPTGYRSQGGLGIGLTLAKSLVELHGGSIDAHSPGLGQGSEFVVRLPTPSDEGAGQREGRGQQSAPPPMHPPSPRPLSPRRVLVVDDNTDAADSLSMLLRLLGHEVRVAYDGPTALAAAAGGWPDLVLLDIGMPGMDGYEVARRLRQRTDTADTKIVALTGWGQEEDRRRSREAGFDHHLVKPADPDVLQQLLAQMAAS